MQDPFAGGVEIVYKEPSFKPSASVALRSPVMAESSLRDLDVSPEITDGSSTGEITRLIICEVLLPSSSVTKTVNESLPKKLGAGVYVQFPSAGSIIDDPLFGAVVMEKYEPSVNPSISVALRSFCGSCKHSIHAINIACYPVTQFLVKRRCIFEKPDVHASLH